MPSISFFNHTGGIKGNLSPFLLGNTETPDSQNVEYEGQLGAFSKSKQYTSIGVPSGTEDNIQGIFPFENPFGVRRLYAMREGTLSQLEDASTGDWTQLATGYNSTDKFESVMLYDNMYYTSFSSGLFEADSAGNRSEVGQNAKYLEAYKNRLYLGNVSAGANRFMWSDLGDGTTYASVNFSDDIDGGITGMKAAFNYLYLFTDKNFYRYDERYLTKIDDTGCTSHRSIAVGDGLMFWANREGVWATYGGRPQLISRPVQQWWDKITNIDFDDLNGIFFDHEYFLAIGGPDNLSASAASGIVLVYNAIYKTWRVLSNWEFSRVMVVWTDATNKRNLYWGDYSQVFSYGEGVGYYLDPPADDFTEPATAVDGIYTYPVLTPAGGDKEFQGTSLYLYAQADGLATFQIEYALDWDDTFKELTSWSLRGFGQAETIRIDVPKSLSGKAIQWRIKESTLVPWKFQGMKFYYEVLGGVGE